jgi:tetratricopeptide (TPR) repeat protein
VLALVGALVAMLLIVLLWPASRTAPADREADTSTDRAVGGLEPRFQINRSRLQQRLEALEGRGAGQWGGTDYASAKTLEAEAQGAHDAGNVTMAVERQDQAARQLDAVESAASRALEATLAAGEKALAAGEQELALQDFDLARRIDARDPRIAADERRARTLTSALPLLAAARNAESAHNYTRAVQAYGHLLSQDPGNPIAAQGLARVTAAGNDERFAKAIGRGFTALAAGRLKEAKDAFEKARALRPGAGEPQEGLKRVAAASAAKGFTNVRNKAAALEAQGRWEEAGEIYDSVLQQDPSIGFAREGKERVQAHQEPAGSSRGHAPKPASHDTLGRSLQTLIDHPEKLITSRQEAGTLLKLVASDPSPELLAQATRLQGLLAQLEIPVHLSLVSDEATLVVITGIGEIGTFGRRDIDLKPGQYTLIGTRDGYRDVRREITVAPGEENATISVSCTEPLAPT